MAKFRVWFSETAEYSVVVEVEPDEDGELDENAAIEAAYNEADFPYFPGGMSGDLGEWFVEDNPSGVEQVDDDEPVGDGRYAGW